MCDLKEIGRSVLAALALGLMATPAVADSAPASSRLFDAGIAPSQLTVRTKAISAGGRLRVAVYASEADFLKNAVAKYDASVDEEGLAQIDLTDLDSGLYAVVVYHDVNEDGRLNRTAVGLPKEPYAFSNGIRPKLKRPSFDEAAVVLTPGAVIEISLKG